MAGLRQYANPIDMPFDIAGRGNGRTIQHEIEDGNVIVYTIGGTGATFPAVAGGDFIVPAAQIVDFSTLVGVAQIGTINRFAIQGVVQYPGPAAGRTHVIHLLPTNAELIMSFQGTYDIRTPGTYVAFWNNLEKFIGENQLPGTTANGFWYGRHQDANAAGNVVDDRAPRGVTLGTNLATNKCTIRYGCSISLPRNVQAIGSGRDNLRFVLGEMYDTVTTDNSDDLNMRMIFYNQGGTVVSNTILGLQPDNHDIEQLITPAEIIPSGYDFRGFAFQIVDSARIFFEGLSALPGTTAGGFVYGNTPNAGVRGWFKSVNPTAVVSIIGSDDPITILYNSTVVSWRNNQRWVELMRVEPQFTELEAGAISGADGVNIRVNYGYGFTSTDDFRANAGASTHNYITNAAGDVTGNTNSYNAHSGVTGAIPAAGNARGLLPIVGIYGTSDARSGVISTTDIRDNYINTFDIRSFYHELPGGQIAFTLDKAALDLQASGAATALAPAGESFILNNLLPIDPVISADALYSTGTTKRTAAELVTYFNAIFTSTSRVTPQNIADALKHGYSSLYLDGIGVNQRAGNILLLNGNLNFDSSIGDVILITGSGDPIIRAAGIAPPGLTDEIQEIGSIVPANSAISYNNSTLPAGYVFNALLHDAITPQTFVGVTFEPGASVQFSNGSYTFDEDCDTDRLTAADITAWIARTTNPASVTLVSELGNDVFAREIAGQSLRQLLVAGNFVVPAPVAPPTTRTFTHPDEDGTWSVYETSNPAQSSFLTATVKYTSGGTPNTYDLLSNAETSAGTPRSISVFWKADNTNAMGYFTDIVEGLATDVTVNATVTLESRLIPAALYSGTAFGTAVITAQAPAAIGSASTNDGFQIRINTGNLTAGSSGPYQNLLLRITNDVRYITTLANNYLIGLTITTDYIIPDGAETSSFDARLVELNTALQGPPIEQQTVLGVSAANPITATPTITVEGVILAGAGSTGLSGASVLLLSNPAGASPGQISTAVDNAINNNIEVGQLRNAAGYNATVLGANPIITAPGGSTAYDNTIDYTTNL